MLDVMYEAFIDNTAKLEELMKDFDGNQKDIKCMIAELGSFWESPESEEFRVRYKKVKNDKEEFRCLAEEVLERMQELSGVFKNIVNRSF